MYCRYTRCRLCRWGILLVSWYWPRHRTKDTLTDYYSHSHRESLSTRHSSNVPMFQQRNSKYFWIYFRKNTCFKCVSSCVSIIITKRLMSLSSFISHLTAWSMTRDIQFETQVHHREICVNGKLNILIYFFLVYFSFYCLLDPKSQLKHKMKSTNRKINRTTYRLTEKLLIIIRVFIFDGLSMEILLSGYKKHINSIIIS